MTKQEYKRLSHEIRAEARNRAKHNTRSELHNLFCWCDDFTTDKFGKSHYTYCCIGDYFTGLVWEKAHNVCNNVYNFI